jgi:tetratricopeptide (TPR) repeat protein
MGMILCSSRSAAHPMYIEELGVRLYSLEELCYFIFRYPLLVLDDFTGEPLFEFIHMELGEEELANTLSKLKRDQTTDEDLLCLILKESGFYGSSEVHRYEQQLQALKKLHPAEYMKRKADGLFRLKRFGKAIQLYEKILAMPDDQTVNGAFRGAVYNNIGSCYANLFLTEQAYRAYDKAYGLLKDRAILKRIYFLSLTEPVIELKERYQSMTGDESSMEWDREYEKVRMDVRECEARKKVDAIFERDPVRRMKLASEQIETWKQNFRNML